MAADNEVQILFSVKDDNAEYSKASHSAAWSSIDERSDKQRSFETQAERISKQKKVEIEEEHSNWHRMEHRLEHRMKHMGAKMAGAFAAEEIGAALGVHESFLGRMGESAIEGGMMGGPQGAAIRMSLTLIHGIIDRVKEDHEEIKQMKERQQKESEQVFKNWLDFIAEQNEHKRAVEDRLREIEDKFKREYRDYVMNAARFINAPYLGAGG